MKTVVVICQKGGVGKTTTALNFGAGLANKKKKVLFVDLDAQWNMTHTMSGDTDKPSAWELLTGEAPVQDIIQQTPCGDLIPASPRMAWSDSKLLKADYDTLITRALYPVQGKYDYCILDTPPALGMLTTSALTAANDAIITVQADPFSLRAIGQLAITMNAVRSGSNPNLNVAGILLTRHNPRPVISREVADLIAQAAEAIGTTVFKTFIREAVAIRESQAYRQTIFQYAPRSSVAADYKAVVDEYLKRTKSKS